MLYTPHNKKTFVRNVGPDKELHIDPKSGIAWVENGATGTAHSCHPNIHGTGSVGGMRKRGYWKREERAVRCHGFIYNIDLLVISDEYDEIARQHCRCGGKHFEDGKRF